MTQSRRRAFTLIEAAVVLVVFGILAGIAVPTYTTFMDDTDYSAAEQEALSLVRNAEAVSSVDGYPFTCPPVPSGDTTTFAVALEQVDDEQGSGGSGPWVNYTGTNEEGLGVIEVIGSRATYTFTVDLCTGAITSIGDVPPSGPVLSVTYPDVTFNPLIPGDSLTPTVTGGPLSEEPFSVSGDLPPGISFDPATGTFTGSQAWNFKATQVDGSALYGCAVTTLTTVKCWGDNSYGGLGIGTIYGVNDDVKMRGPVDVLAPGQAAGGSLLTGVLDVSVNTDNDSWAYACALTTSGNVLCWGSNLKGQLGDGTVHWSEAGVSPISRASSVPKYVVGVGQTAGGAPLSGVTALSTGTGHACAVLSNSTAVCWGQAETGALGNGLSGQESSGYTFTSPQRVLAPGQPVGGAPLSGVVQVAAGSMNGCAVLQDTRAVCWGNNSYGAGGVGSVANYSVHGPTFPQFVLAVGESTGGSHLYGAAQIATSGTHTCAIDVNGRVACWGRNNLSPGVEGLDLLGTGQDAIATLLSPALVLDETDSPLEGAVSIQSKTGPLNAAVCVVLTDSSAKCWGNAGRALLGRGDDLLNATGFQRLSGNVPRRISSLVDSYSPAGSSLATATGITSLGMGAFGLCALTTSSSVYCWGKMYTGDYGFGAVPALTSTFPLRLARSGSQSGFPAALTVTVTDTEGNSASVNVTLDIS